MPGYTRLLSPVLLLLLTPPAFAQEAPVAVIWHDRGDAAALNLLTGPGGVGQEPGTNFRFIKESTSGTSPKFTVEDERGVRWKVKLGEEGRGETAAARLLWAAGYAVDEDYYRQHITVREMQPLARGRQFVSADRVTGVRLERDLGDEESNSWSWYDNPFVGTREFNGLRVMMALINNWDLKAVNNGESGASVGRGIYGITDLGAAFGRTGNLLRRSKGVSREYADSRFVDEVGPASVSFVMHSRPFFPTIVHVSNYRFRTRMERIVKDVPIADARWLGFHLGRLSATQIGDCFRAGGFPDADVVSYTQVVLRRIAELQALVPTRSNTPRHDNTNSSTDTDTADGSRHDTRPVPLRETLSAFPLGTPYLRAVMNGFEQGAGIGAGLRLTTAQALPVVELRATALTSTRRFARYEVEAFLPGIGGSRTHVDVWFTYLKRDTGFFGPGAPEAPDGETTFAIERRSYQGSVYRDVTDHLQAGLYAQAMHSRGVLSEQVTRSTILSYGGFLSYDRRDTSEGLTRGLFAYGRLASADGRPDRDGADPFGWMETEIDVRGYLPLGSRRTSLLVRSRGQFKSPRAGNQIPYFDLSWLGGRAFLRGLPNYRIRAHTVLLLAAELQQTVLSMTPTRGIDVLGSADTGQAWEAGLKATRGPWYSGLGGGLQYRHSRSVAVRVEVSRGDEGTLTYASLSRGF